MMLALSTVAQTLLGFAMLVVVVCLGAAFVVMAFGRVVSHVVDAALAAEKQLPPPVDLTRGRLMPMPPPPKAISITDVRDAGRILSALRRLPDGAQELLCLRFGVAVCEATTLETIARERGVHAQQVRVDEFEALAALVEEVYRTTGAYEDEHSGE